MSLFNVFGSKKQGSASIAKERLQIIVAHERRRSSSPDYLPQLQQDILAVVRKYVQVHEDQISLNVDRQDDSEVLEVNILLSDQ